MTPCINAAKKAGISYQVHEYQHDPASKSYGNEAIEKLGVDEAKVFKTLVVKLATGDLAVAVIPVLSKLNLKLMAKATNTKKSVMAAPQDVERTTGYVLGGVSPLGQKKRLKTVIDHSANDHPTIFVSAGKRGLEIELVPNDLAKLVNGILADIC